MFNDTGHLFSRWLGWGGGCQTHPSSTTAWVCVWLCGGAQGWGWGCLVTLLMCLVLDNDKAWQWSTQSCVVNPTIIHLNVSVTQTPWESGDEFVKKEVSSTLLNNTVEIEHVQHPLISQILFYLRFYMVSFFLFFFEVCALNIVKCNSLLVHAVLMCFFFVFFCTMYVSWEQLQAIQITFDSWTLILFLLS